MQDLIAEIERRAEQAYKTPQGPDYRAIVEDVADSANVDVQELREACLKAWTVGVGS